MRGQHETGRARKPILTSPQGARVVLDSRAVIMLGSNDYLGLANHPEIIARAREALGKYGAGPALNPPLATTPIHEELCDALARFHGTESALLFNSCTAANVAVATTLAGEHDHLFSDRLNHASIIDGCRLSAAAAHVYRHDDFDHLDALLAEAARGTKLVITDGVFSMEGEAVDLARLGAVSAKHDALLAVDESHAAGVIGPGGRGTAAFRNWCGRIGVITGTLSKAFGAFAGGYVAASTDMIRELHDRGRFFMFTTAISPSAAAGALAAIKLVMRDDTLVRRLAANTAHFRAGLSSLGLKLIGGDSPITPIMIGDEDNARALSRELLESSVYIGAIGYPVVPRGEARLRAQPSAAHTQADLDEAVDKIGRAARTLHII